MVVALVYGGFSGEAEVSRKSALEIFARLKELHSEVYMVNISKEGWFAEHQDTKYPIDKNDFSFSLNGIQVRFNKVFNILHGAPGEDGRLSSYFDLIGVEHNTSSTVASALTFNKNWSNRFLSTYGVTVPQSVVFYANEDNQQHYPSIKFPCFVKPNNGGSSIGTHKCYNVEELERAVKDAFQHDDEVIVEEFIEGREFSCGILNLKDGLKVMPLTEIIPNSDFFDYKEKYSANGATEVTPADLPANKMQECQAIVEKVFKILRLKKVARIDFILKDDEFYLIEVNTIPGMSPRSILPQQALHEGIDFKELVNLLLL